MSPTSSAAPTNYRLEIISDAVAACINVADCLYLLIEAQETGRVCRTTKLSDCEGLVISTDTMNNIDSMFFGVI